MKNFAFPAHVKRVAFAGDWHGDILFAQRMIREASKQNADVIVHVGDFGYDFNATFIGKLTRNLNEVDLHLLFVDGNHENFNYLYGEFPTNEDGVRPISDRMAHLPRGFRWKWNGSTFLALGGAHSVDRQNRKENISWWAQERITYEDVMRAIDGGPVDYMITHDVPMSVDFGLTPNSYFPQEELAESDKNRTMLDIAFQEVQPKGLWAGHYHQRSTVNYTFPNGKKCEVNILDRDWTPVERNMQVVDL